MGRLTPSALAGASTVVLLVWLSVWLGIGAAAGILPASGAVLLAWLPLLPALPAVFRGSRKAAGWSCLAGVFYAGFAIMELTANPASRAWASVALALALTMIAAQVRMIRGR